MQKIGFIGLGNMGRGMVKNLINQNFYVSGFDVDDSVYGKLKNLDIKKKNNLQDLVKDSDLIITMLPDGQIVKKVWEELINLCKNSQPLIDCSTIDVATSIAVQKLAIDNNQKTLDAPVSGGVMGAEAGTLTFMVGGESNIYEQYKHLFKVMGNNSILCGSNGAGQAAKICNNMLLATTMIAVGESFKLGENLKLDPKKLFEVLSTSSGACWAINNYCPYKNVGPKSPADNEYKGGFSSALMLKDLSLAMQASVSTKTTVSYGNQTYELFEKIVNEQKKGSLDFSNVVNVTN